MNCELCNASVPDGSSTCPCCGASCEASRPAELVDDPLEECLPVGTALHGGHYRIGRVLGHGGFGVTYQGADIPMQLPVAIKEFFPSGCLRRGLNLLPGRKLPSQEFTEQRVRFLDEARVLARLNHRGIVRVYTAFEENNTAYMVMEYLRGQTLEARISERGRLGEKEVRGYVCKLAEALETMHGQCDEGILHRDIKPANIMFTPEGRVVLIDFGTARQFAANVSRAMSQVLTPGYAPLEQYSARARYGPPLDIYALGATMYHALTGQVPPDALERAQGLELKSPQAVCPSVSRRTSDAVMAAMEVSAARRPQSIADLLRVLKSGSPPTSAPRAASGPPQGAANPQDLLLELMRQPPVLPRAQPTGSQYGTLWGSVAYVLTQEKILEGSPECSGKLICAACGLQWGAPQSHWPVCLYSNGAKVCSDPKTVLAIRPSLNCVNGPIHRLLFQEGVVGAIGELNAGFDRTAVLDSIMPGFHRNLGTTADPKTAKTLNVNGHPTEFLPGIPQKQFQAFCIQSRENTSGPALQGSRAEVENQTKILEGGPRWEVLRPRGSRAEVETQEKILEGSPECSGGLICAACGLQWGAPASHWPVCLYSSGEKVCLDPKTVLAIRPSLNGVGGPIHRLLFQEGVVDALGKLNAGFDRTTVLNNIMPGFHRDLETTADPTTAKTLNVNGHPTEFLPGISQKEFQAFCIQSHEVSKTPKATTTTLPARPTWTPED